MNDLNGLRKKLKNIYSRDLCYPPIRGLWSKANPTLGMCSITALLVQDYFGGDIYRTIVDNDSHYFNIINGAIVDLTAEQFGHEIAYENIEKANRATMLTRMNTEARYLELKKRVETLLV